MFSYINSLVSGSKLPITYQEGRVLTAAGFEDAVSDTREIFAKSIPTFEKGLETLKGRVNEQYPSSTLSKIGYFLGIGKASYNSKLAEDLQTVIFDLKARKRAYDSGEFLFLTWIRAPENQNRSYKHYYRLEFPYVTPSRERFVSDYTPQKYPTISSAWNAPVSEASDFASSLGATLIKAAAVATFILIGKDCGVSVESPSGEFVKCFRKPAHLFGPPILVGILTGTVLYKCHEYSHRVAHVTQTLFHRAFHS